ncbi:hypothetical protein VRU48_01970 [Pedobacter sp. KR3-3]|uniref:Uncharacterized protein n=1 Tax=Pedobacter albus TaxID=3113905 RepID=A0ABU7I323_9SPHI|nr:hypothetical protein [Pedobacter sp. KR3-3]MEE1943855.1 hypothetical protein [Pedobacter sp. KR3-3]
MEYNENIAGLGKNHDQEAKLHDLAKKQSEAKPAAENLDGQPYSINKKQISNSAKTNKQVHEQAQDYAKKEHQKADKWEDTSGAEH